MVGRGRGLAKDGMGRKKGTVKGTKRGDIYKYLARNEHDVLCVSLLCVVLSSVP